MSILKVEGLTKEFGGIKAVNNLSFAVEPGSVCGFLGQNGAGKSTTIRMLLTLIRPTSGSVEIFGENLFTHRSSILKNIGAVIEKPDVYPYLSGYDNLRLFARLSGIKPANSMIMDKLELVGLSGRAHDKVSIYSQGMKQRLGLAIALIHDPQLIILDEPTNGLDPQGIADIRNLIVYLSRDRNKTILVSSHLLSEVEQMATHVLIIDKGRKLVDGPSASLFDPSETVVEIEAVNTDFARSKLLTSPFAGNLMGDRGNFIILKIHRDNIPLLHRHLVQQGVELIRLQPRHSLEDYFLQVTNDKTDAYTYTG